MDAPHALLKPGRVPRHVVVDHDPAELQVDAFGGSVGTDHQSRSARGRRQAETLDLFLTLRVVHAAMDLCDLPGVAQPAEAADQETEGIPVLSEDQHLLVGETAIRDDLAKSLELRIGPCLVDVLGKLPQGHHLLPLRDQLRQGLGDHPLQKCVLTRLVLFTALA